MNLPEVLAHCVPVSNLNSCIPRAEYQSIDRRESPFDRVEGRNRELELEVSDRGVAWRPGNLLGHPPSRWKVCAAVKLTRDAAVTRKVETATMVLELICDWESQLAGMGGQTSRYLELLYSSREHHQHLHDRQVQRHLKLGYSSSSVELGLPATT